MSRWLWISLAALMVSTIAVFYLLYTVVTSIVTGLTFFLELILIASTL